MMLVMTRVEEQMRLPSVLIFMRLLILMIFFVLFMARSLSSGASEKTNSLKKPKGINISGMRTRSDREARTRPRTLKRPVLLTVCRSEDGQGSRVQQRTWLLYGTMAAQQAVFVPDQNHDNQIEHSEHNQTQRTSVEETIKLIDNKQAHYGERCWIRPQFIFEEAND
jgi:hypothetical protein